MNWPEAFTMVGIVLGMTLLLNGWPNITINRKK
jgi:hypothetical protein